LYALTDYIDCDALADTCEANLTEVKEIMEVSEQSDVTKLQPVDKEQEEIHVVENIKGVSSVNCKDRTTSNCPIENIAINW
jgi:hypothetical protein